MNLAHVERRKTETYGNFLLAPDAGGSFFNESENERRRLSVRTGGKTRTKKLQLSSRSWQEKRTRTSARDPFSSASPTSFPVSSSKSAGSVNHSAFMDPCAKDAGNFRGLRTSSRDSFSPRITVSRLSFADAKSRSSSESVYCRS